MRDVITYLGRSKHLDVKGSWEPWSVSFTQEGVFPFREFELLGETIYSTLAPVFIWQARKLCFGSYPSLDSLWYPRPFRPCLTQWLGLASELLAWVFHMVLSHVGIFVTLGEVDLPRVNREKVCD